MDAPKDIYTPPVAKTIRSQRDALIVTADRTNDAELLYVYYRLVEEGYTVDLATPEGGKVTAAHGTAFETTKKLAEIDPSRYNLLYIPGGKAPAALREDEAAIAIVKHFVREQKPVAAICHGAQLLAAADVIRDKKIAAWPDVEAEITEAGGLFVNEACVEDGLFITGRWPADLPFFTPRVLDALQNASPQQFPKAASAR